MTSVLKWYFKSSLLMRIFAGLLLGIAAGICFGPDISFLKPIGDIFIRLLKMVVVPIVLSSLVTGAASLSPKRLGRLGLKSFMLFMGMTCVALVMGLVVGNLFQPGRSLELSVAGDVVDSIEPPPLSNLFVRIIPTNPLQSIVSGDMLGIIFFAILFGIGLSVVKNGEKEGIRQTGQTVYAFFQGVCEVMYHMVRWILEVAPFGVFVLIAYTFGQQGVQALMPLGKLIMALFFAYLVHMALFYGLMLRVNGIGIWYFFRHIKEALVMALSTRSSSATLPVSMDCAEHNLKIDRSISSFTLPLGTTLNMDGTAIYHAICALFIANAIGAPLSLGQQAVVLTTALLSSIGTVGVSGSGPIILLMVLDAVGLKVVAGSPVAMAYTMIVGVDAIADMGRTVLNVTGDLVVTAIVAKSEGAMESPGAVS